VIAAPTQPVEYHAKLSATLRRRGALAASEGRRVAALAGAASIWDGVDLHRRAILARGPAAIGGERGRALDELRDAVEVARRRGDSGEIEVEDYLAEVLLLRSPRIADQIAGRIYGPLAPELQHTLDVLARHNFERSSTAAALPVHRNTLRDRINRISEITGVDLDSAYGRGLAWLAWLQRSAGTG
jgi:DNA-binding PucR family transcriptional regulator